MVRTIYIEEEVEDHPRVLEICERFPRAVRIPCGRYGEVFKRRAQNFRLQKRRPALILARKHDGFVLEAPSGYGIGGERNYYFSHMLNCVYDCRYCFLQGMFRSAHYVLFVNYEDFEAAIERKLGEEPSQAAYFFSGYDCDSLALEPVTGFAAHFLPVFRRLDGAWLELRTKSVQTKALLASEPAERCVVAFSFTPQEVAEELENVPSVERRVDAMVALQERGWKLGLRFDPLIYGEGYESQYRGLFETVFRRLRPASLHSVSFGPFRLPRDIHRNMLRLFPDEPLLAGPLQEQRGMVSYRADLEREIVEFCRSELARHVPEEIFFPCGL